MFPGHDVHGKVEVLNPWTLQPSMFPSSKSSDHASSTVAFDVAVHNENQRANIVNPAIKCIFLVFI
jgi:hypothetical protein